jgi:hypothetical protein
MIAKSWISSRAGFILRPFLVRLFLKTSLTIFGFGWHGVTYEKAWYLIRMVRTLNRTKKRPLFLPGTRLRFLGISNQRSSHYNDCASRLSCCRVRVECEFNYFITEGLSTSVSHFQINFLNLTHFTKIFTVSSRLHN